MLVWVMLVGFAETDELLSSENLHVLALTSANEAEVR